MMAKRLHPRNFASAGRGGSLRRVRRLLAAAVIAMATLGAGCAPQGIDDAGSRSQDHDAPEIIASAESTQTEQVRILDLANDDKQSDRWAPGSRTLASLTRARAEQNVGRAYGAHDGNELRDVELEAELAMSILDSSAQKGDKSQGPESLANVPGDDGNNVLAGTPDPDVLEGFGGRDTLLGSLGADVMDGGGDFDTATYISATAAVSVNLATGTGSGDLAEGDQLIGIESVRGGNFDDSITGDGEANILLGAGGNDTLSGGGDRDTLIGGPGADSHIGGDGFDTASYQGSTAAVSASLANGGSAGDAAGDSYSGVESLRGSDFGDTLGGDDENNILVGAGGGDTLNGGGGDDSFLGGLGADSLNGGDGTDLASYAASTVAVTVNLATGTASGGEAQGDTLTGIENVRGTNFSDTLIGNDEDNDLTGASGTDVLSGGGGDDGLLGGEGADTLDGGEGSDFVSYNGSTASVTVDLAGPQSAVGGHATGDTLTNFENAVGSQFDDNLSGSATENIFDGLAGNDVIDGRGGQDTVVYASRPEGFVINLGAGTAVSAAAGESDTLISIENAVGGQGNDSIVGTAGNNTIVGLQGNDDLNGAGGVDEVSYSTRVEAFTIDLAAGTASAPSTGELDSLAGFEDASGGLSDDTLIGDAGSNVLHGGPGADTVNGGDGEDFASYANANAPVSADLLSGTGTAGDAVGDQFSNIEGLRGSDFGDTLAGDDLVNVLVGGDGDDSLDGRGGDDSFLGGVGADTLIGGLGRDLAVYTNALAGVTINLATGTGAGDIAAGDQLTGIENVRGSEFADQLIGDAGANVLTGGGGDDVINGGAGSDSLLGSAGDDLFVFQPNFGRDVIFGFAAGAGSEDVLDVSAIGFTSLAQILANASQQPDRLVIRLNATNTISLLGVTLGALSADDFIFAP